MTARLIRLPRYEPGSPEWNTQRAFAVGGSEIAAVVGLSPWESRFSLWHRKKGNVPPLEENEQMRWGKHLEEPIARWFAQAHPEFKVRRTGTFTPFGRPYQIVSPDRECLGRIPVEIKKSYDDTGWGKPGTDDIPIYYWTQCVWQMDALGVDYGWLAVLIGGAEYREYRIGHDKVEAQRLLDAAAAFVGTLKRDEVPPIDEHGETFQVLRNLHPSIDGIDGTDRTIGEEQARSYRNAIEAGENADAELQLQKNLLLAEMGDARNAVYQHVVGGQLVSTRLAMRQPNGTDPKTGEPRLCKLVPTRKLTETLTFPATTKRDAA